MIRNLELHGIVSWACSCLARRGNDPNFHCGKGGLASGALGGRLPKAAAAFAAAWSQTAEYVCKIMGEQSMPELLACDAALAHQLQAAADKLTAVGLQPLSTPWNNHDVPAPFRQSKILKKLAATARSRCTSALPRVKAAQWRSSSGPGSSGFLLIPNDEQLLIDNVLFRISLARRFGGGLRLQDLNAAPPQCAHCGRHGPCTGSLDHDGHHASTCNIGGFILRRHDRLVKWIASWLREDRADSDVRLEQSLFQDPPGRMDVALVRAIPKYGSMRQSSHSHPPLRGPFRAMAMPPALKRRSSELDMA